jgi:cytoplasmic tRNA 2-thiolation protein 2
MPGRRERPPIDLDLCRRCQANEPVLTVRNEPLCKACFCKYVSTKVVKRMESFRVRYSQPGEEPTLLLSLSFGVSSMALLHLLSEHLKGQAEKTGRTGFQLFVLHVSSADSEAEDAILLEKVKSRYPDHIYIASPLSDIFSFEGHSSLQSQQAVPEEHSDPDATNQEKLGLFLRTLSSATSRTDATQLLKRKLVVNIAKHHNCEAVLWADSTTKLAERTLSETAKGRGFALPWIVADGESSHGIQFYYPMRELLSKEIEAYGSILDPPLDGLAVVDAVKPAVSTKNMTIDDLMKQYFESVERDYPSIVANVVKTAGKLEQVELSQIESCCELCEMPLLQNAPERSRLCYGCVRTFPQLAR